MTQFKKLLFASAFSLAAASTAAKADIIIALSAAPTLGADGNYVYTYNVQLAGQSQLDGTATAAADGTTVGNRQFATLYDFGPLATNSSGVIFSSTGLVSDYFTFAIANTFTPAATSSSFNDDPTLANVRLIYSKSTGTDIFINGQGFSAPAGTAYAFGIDVGAANLGTFTIESIYGPSTRNVSYDSYSFKSTNNTPQQNLGTTAAPLPNVAVPEPASLALLGAGLIGAGLVRRRANRAA